MIGIYKITNQVTGQVYIGQSNDIKRRWKDHKRYFKYRTANLYKAMRDYGVENFLFEILEECDLEELNSREHFYIQKYNSLNEGYNMSTIENLHHKINQNIADKIINELANTSLTGFELAEKYQVSNCLISQINTGKMWYNPNVNYPIRPRIKIEENKCIDCGTIISQKALRCVSCENRRRRNNNQTKDSKNTIKDNKNTIKDNKNTTQKNYCLDCGKEITKKACRCLSCESKRKKRQLKITKNITREELKEFIRTKSFCEIGRLLGITDNAVRKWCKKYNLPYRKKDILSYSDVQWKEL